MYSYFAAPPRSISIVRWIPAVMILAASCCDCGTRKCEAQDAESRHQMVMEHLKQQAVKVSSDCLTNVSTLDDWKRIRPQLKLQMLDMLGLDPYPVRTPLKVKVTGTLKRAEYTIEKIVFQSMPGLYVTGNFYVPEKADQPLPTILYLCGHSPGPFGAKVNYQDRAVWFA